MNVLKWILLVLSALLLLIAAGLYILLSAYKGELQQLLIGELKSRHGIDLHAESIKVSLFSNWPHASLRFVNVNLQSDKFPDSRIHARSISASFNIEKLLRRQFILHRVTFRDADIVIAKPPDEPAPLVASANAEQPVSFEIRHIGFRNCRVRVQNPLNGQDLAFDLLETAVKIKNFADGFVATVRGDVNIRGLQFRANRGHFLTKANAYLDIGLNFLKQKNTLCIQPGSVAKVEGKPFNLCGLAILGDEKRLALIIEGNALDYRQTVRLLNYRIQKSLNNFDLRQPFDAKVILSASMGKREEPAFIIDLRGKQNNLRIGTSKIPYSNLSFHGRIVCVDSSGKRGDVERAIIEFRKLRGNIYDIPFNANVKVVNLTDPHIRIDGHLNIDASKLKFNLEKEFDLRGSALAHVRYSGPAEKLNNDEFLDPQMKLSAQLKLHNLSYREKGKSRAYTLNGTASVNNKDLKLEEVQLATDVGTADLSGRAEGFTRYLMGFAPGFNADLTVRMDSINLDPLSNDTLDMLPDSSVITTVAQPGDDGELAATACQFDRSCSSFTFNVRLFADHFKFRQVHGEKVRMQVKYHKSHFEFPIVELRTCDGRLKASGSISAYKILKAEVSLHDVDVKELFRQFENFGQETISGENLRGRLYLDANFNTRLTNRLMVAPETMFADVNLNVKDGHLVNFEPIQKLSNFLFSGRNFDDVSFSELNEAFVVRGPLLEINGLQIASSLLDLYVVNGVYNFRGQSNINVLIPWHNLKKRDRDFIPSLSGKSAESAKGVKVNFSGTPNKMKLNLGHREAVALRSSI
jgi:hypothetical protein